MTKNVLNVSKGIVLFDHIKYILSVCVFFHAEINLSGNGNQVWKSWNPFRWNEKINTSGKWVELSVNHQFALFQVH